MYSKMELTQNILRNYGNNSNQEILDGWINYQEAMAFSDYDETTEEWHWGMMFFSEDFAEMLPMFAFVISMEKYVMDSSENKAIIFPFFWETMGLNAYIYFENNKTILSPKVQILKDIDPNFVKQTKHF